MSNWQLLESVDQLSTLNLASYERPQLIFKHSTRCGISFQVKDVLFSATGSLSGCADLHFLDLISFRSLSNYAASTLGVPHQSPQVLLIREGSVVYHSSHFGIDTGAILAAAC